MTSDELQTILDKFGAVSYNNEIVAPCPICQEEERAADKFKFVISPGYKYVAVPYCRYCCNRVLSQKDWWLQVCDFYGICYFTFTVPVQECPGIWSSITVNTQKVTKCSPGPNVLLDKVYSTLLESLDLSDKHRKWLEKKGLNADWAYSVGYRSTDKVKKLKGIDVVEVDELIPNCFTVDELVQVPGFYCIDKITYCGLRQSAILIPSRNYSGQIQAIKQRLLDHKTQRMRWLASIGEDAPMAVNLPHCPLGVGAPNSWPEVWITEGERKADINWIVGGKPTIGIPGTGCWKIAVPAIKKIVQSKGVVVLAFDQDKAGEAATKQLLKLLQDSEEVIKVASWSTEKGIDDAIVKGVEVKLNEYKNKSIPTTLQKPKLKQAVPIIVTEDEVLETIRQTGKCLRKSITVGAAYVARLINTKRVKTSYIDGEQYIEAV